MTPVVLVPGLLCTAEVFAPQIPALWPHGPVTIASTLTGETIPEVAADILASAPPRFALAGISMGGHISLEIMRQAPERVLGLALLDTSPRPDTPEQTAQRKAMIEQARAGQFSALVELLAGAVFHPAHRSDARLGEMMTRMSHTVGLDGFARQQQALIARPDSRPSLGAIRVRTLVLVGDSDLVAPPEQAREFAVAIQKARFVIVEQCGHGSTLEQPEAVNRAMIEWITGVDAKGARP